MCTPVHYAATLDDAKVIEMMLKKSNSVNEVDAQMKTALFYAVFNNSSEQVNIIRVLIENGAKVNQKDCEGRTPLHYAS
jgi:serine/threonine-protein phosphatase 6 regulatory ankyrin repeat subunit A